MKTMKDIEFKPRAGGICHVVRVDRATPAIVTVLRSLAEELEPIPDAQNFEARIKRLATSSSGAIIIAVPSKDDWRDHEVMGMAVIASVETVLDNHLQLHDLVVATSLRNHGVGRELVWATVQAAIQLNAAFIELTANPKKRSAAIKLYEDFGFVRRATDVMRKSW